VPIPPDAGEAGASAPLTCWPFRVYEPITRRSHPRVLGITSCSGWFWMKTALRVAALILTAVIGLWAFVRGIVTALLMRGLPGEHADILGHLVEASVFIAGGVCVLSLAVQQLYCWRAHRKDGGLL